MCDSTLKKCTNVAIKIDKMIIRPIQSLLSISCLSIGGSVFTIVIDNKIRIINMDINFQPWKSTNSENKNNLAFVNRIEVGKEVVIPFL